MHECPECGMACDCDGEDTWMDSAALDCSCDCCLDDEDTMDDDAVSPESA